jgi:beta-glucosidase-like glycosyl hydrolase
MPGNDSFGEPLKKAVESGEVPMERLNDMVHRVLRTEFDAGIVDDPPQPDAPDVMRGFEVAQKTEERGAVLLKNEGKLLPLSGASIKSIVGSEAMPMLASFRRRIVAGVSRGWQPRAASAGTAEEPAGQLL